MDHHGISSSSSGRIDNLVCVIDGEPASIYCCICDKYYCDIDNANFHNSNPELVSHMRLRLKPLAKGNKTDTGPSSPPVRPSSPPVVEATVEEATVIEPVDVKGKNDEAQTIAEGLAQGAEAFGKGVYQGLTGIVMDPIRGGKEEGAVGVLKGTVTGIGNVAVKPVRGTGELLSRAAEGLRNTPGAIFSNGEEHKQQDQIKHVGDGLYVGAKNFGMGLIDGLTGVVMEPVKGAEKDGVSGFFMGVGKGLFGAVCKPVAGAIDLVAKPIEGIANTPGTIAEKFEDSKKKEAAT